MRKILIGLITTGLLLIGATSVIGETLKSPAEIYAEIKGISVDEAYAQRNAGNGLCWQDEDAGAREEFRAQMLEDKKAFIQEKVTAGELTQQEADEIIADIENNLANCGGPGYGRSYSGNEERPEFGQGPGGRGGCWGGGSGAGTTLQ